MIPDIVADVGNSRIKWGRCDGGRIIDVATLSHDSADWELERNGWRKELPAHIKWAIAGVVPASTGKLGAWIRTFGDYVEVIDSYQKVPIAVAVDQPQNVGLDRLLAAIAARAQFANHKLLIVDAGSAITIDLVDHAFRGGAILPGIALMSRSLHEQTAQLPKVTIGLSQYPGRNTEDAIRCGILGAACGAIERIAAASQPEVIFFTGGDGHLLESQVNWPAKRFVRELTLEGIRIAAEALP